MIFVSQNVTFSTPGLLKQGTVIYLCYYLNPCKNRSSVNSNTFRDTQKYGRDKIMGIGRYMKKEQIKTVIKMKG